MLGVESVITKRNLEEIEDLWHFIRGLHLYPYIELTKLVGRANRAYFREKYAIGQKEACQLFKKIARIDREKYKYSWDPLPPILADRCAVYYYSCYVDIQGFVQPCAGVGKHLTNGKVLVKENGSSYRVRLGEVVNSGEFETKVRSVNELPMGKCKKCSLHQEDLNKRKLGCYGCRAQPNICWISDKDAKLIARQRVLYGRH
jgi:MoaA/NifB/PqqE/SkfB family radical SAM enzyme